MRFARDGEVPVERVTTSRTAGDGQRELAGGREARQRAEQTLAEAQAIGSEGETWSRRTRTDTLPNREQNLAS